MTIAGLLGGMAAPLSVAAQSSLGDASQGLKPPVVAAPAQPAHTKPAHSKTDHKKTEHGKAAAHKAPPAKPPGKPVVKPVAKPAVAPAVVPPAAEVAPAPEPAPAPVGQQFVKGSVTGFPLPRFAALKSDKVNMRAGPGTRYQIDWLYQRPNLPVRIEREFDVWRLVVDSEGVKGWVHSANLTGRRGFEIIGAERALRASASDDGSVVARLMPGVVGRIVSCEATASWCKLESGGYEGWLKRDDFWGIFPGEAVP